MIQEVRDLLTIGNSISIKQAYLIVFNKELKKVCSSAIRAARTKLEAWLSQHEYEQTPINIIEGHGKKFSEIEFQPTSINVISNGTFFDDTLENVRKVNGFSAFCLSNWKYENGSIELENGIGAWVIYGVPKTNGQIDLDINDFGIVDKLKYVVLNPAFSIHAIGEKSGLNTLPPYRI